MPVTQTNPFAYDLQRTVDTVLVPGLCTLFAYLSVDKRMLAILF